MRVDQGREEPYRFCGRIIGISNLLRMRHAIWGTRSHSCWERASGCAQTKKQKRLGMVAERPICGKRRHGFRKVVAALCKIGKLEGARENTNERRQLHHLDTRRYFDYTHTCLAIHFSKLCTIKQTTPSVRAAAVFMYSSEHLDGQIRELFELSKINKRSSKIIV